MMERIYSGSLSSWVSDTYRLGYGSHQVEQELIELG